MNPIKNYYIKHKFRLLVAVITITISLFFFVSGSSLLKFAEIFQEGYELQEEISELNDVVFRDNPKVDWLDEIEISKTDYEPLEIHTAINFHALITTKIIPQELVVHIFHEDMSDFFLGAGDFQTMTSESNKIPPLRYGDMYNIKFDMSENLEEKESATYAYNGNENISFKKSGSYFIIVSIKTQDGKIMHYKGSTSVMKIREYNEGYIDRSLDKLLVSAEEQTVANFRSSGMTFIAIGTGMFFSGLNLLMTSIEKKEKPPFYR